MTIPMQKTEEMLRKHIFELCRPEWEGRLAGTEGAARVADYLADELKSMDIEPSGSDGYFQPVDIQASRLTGQAALRVGNLRLRHRIDFGEAWPSSVGTQTGELVVVRDGQDVESELEGKIVLIPQKPQDFDLESTVKAGLELGIKGLLFEEGEPRWFRKTSSVFASSGIPVIRIRKSIAEALEKRSGSVVTIDLPMDTYNAQSHNVIGVMRSAVDSSFTLALTAHYDHIGDDPGSFRYPGAFDNASGVAVILELARKLKNEHPALPFNLLICFLTGEESGLWGAKHLLSHQPSSLSAVINVDVLGLDPEFKEVRIGQIEAENWLVDLTEGVLEKNKIEGRRMKGRDDASVFLAHGIPTIGIGEYRLHNIGPAIHTPDDRVEAVHFEPLLTTIEVIREILHQLSSRQDIINNN